MRIILFILLASVTFAQTQLDTVKSFKKSDLINIANKVLELADSADVTINVNVDVLLNTNQFWYDEYTLLLDSIDSLNSKLTRQQTQLTRLSKGDYCRTDSINNVIRYVNRINDSINYTPVSDTVITYYVFGDSSTVVDSTVAASAGYVYAEEVSVTQDNLYVTELGYWFPTAPTAATTLLYNSSNELVAQTAEYTPSSGFNKNSTTTNPVINSGTFKVGSHGTSLWERNDDKEGITTFFNNEYTYGNWSDVTAWTENANNGTMTPYIKGYTITITDTSTPMALDTLQFVIDTTINLTTPTYFVDDVGTGDTLTITEFNSTNFNSGDKIAFKRDIIFTTPPVITDNGVEIGAYGTGNMPKFGSKSGTWQTSTERAFYINADSVTISNIFVYACYNGTVGRGLNIQGNNVTLENCVVEGDSASVERTYFGISTYPGKTNIHIKNCEVYDVAQGIYLADFKGIVESCYVHDIHFSNGLSSDSGDEADGIRLISNTFGQSFNADSSAIIRYNKITRWKEDAVDVFNVKKAIIANNEIHDPHYNGKGQGISNGGYKSSYNVIERNVIYNLYSDGSDDYTLAVENGGKIGNVAIVGKQGTDATVQYNLVYNTWGVCLTRTGDSQDSSGVGKNYRVYNNTFVSDSCAILMYGSSNTDSYVYNNILKGGNNPSGGDYDFVWSDVARNIVYMDNTILRYDSEVKRLQETYSLGSNSNNQYSTDPLFNGTSDFRLQTGSPAINAGQDIGITIDILGNTIIGNPDIGCYEKQ